MASLRTLVWIDGEHRSTALVRILVIWIGSWVAGFAVYGISGVMEQGGVPEPVLVWVRPLLGYGLPIAAIALGIVFIDRRTVSDWGMTLDRDWWADFGFGLALAAGLLLAIFAIMAAADWIRITGTMVTTDDPPVTGFQANAVRIVVLFIGVGIFEEFFARGFLLANVADGLHGFGPIDRRGAVAVAVGLTAGIFGAFHANNPNASLVSTLGLTAAGILYGTGYVFTGRLALPIGFHIAWNVVEGLVLGFPVSGSREPANLIAVVEQGPDQLTGGAFGPEAGVLGIGARFVCIALILASVRWRYGRVSVPENLTDPTLR